MKSEYNDQKIKRAPPQKKKTSAKTATEQTAKGKSFVAYPCA